MNHAIITIILVAIAAKAKTQAEDTLTRPELGEKPNRKHGAPRKGRGVRKDITHKGSQQ